MGTTTTIKKHATRDTPSKHFPFKQVMVVDDDNMERLLSLAMLRNSALAAEHVHFDSVFASLHYLRSLKHLDEPFPDLILLDLNMPVMDGFDFLEHFMHLPEHLRSNCKVIVVSATESEEEVNNLASYAAVSAFYRKPLTNEVLAEIRTLQL